MKASPSMRETGDSNPLIGGEQTYPLSYRMGSVSSGLVSI